MSKIDSLGKVVADSRQNRAVDEARGRALRERRAEIKEAKANTITDFWCEVCKRDYEAQGVKQVRGEDTWPIAFYASLCPNGHTNIRRITDKLNDPYYWQSSNMRRQQLEHADDFMTPDNPRFKIVYPVQWARLEADRKKREDASAIIITP